MTYRHIIFALFAAGLLAGLILGVFYFIVDRGPSEWNRAARVISGLIAVIILSYGSGVAALATGAVPRTPTNIFGWVAAIGLRGLAVIWLWYLVVIYLSPKRSNGKPDLGESGGSASGP